MANQSGIASRNGSESRLRKRHCALVTGIVERSDASCGSNRLREWIAFMPLSVNDDSAQTNARVWDFVMPR
jgi:hypothetical protein